MIIVYVALFVSVLTGLALGFLLQALAAKPATTGSSAVRDDQIASLTKDKFGSGTITLGPSPLGGLIGWQDDLATRSSRLVEASPDTVPLFGCIGYKGWWAVYNGTATIPHFICRYRCDAQLLINELLPWSGRKEEIQ